MLSFCWYIRSHSTVWYGHAATPVHKNVGSGGGVTEMAAAGGAQVCKGYSKCY